MNELENKVNSRHGESMEFAEMAFFAKRRNEFYNYWKFIQKALNLEKAAARALENVRDAEPSRSVLYKSAAYLALSLDSFDEAEKLLEEGLNGNPPAEIRVEMEGLLATIARKKRIRKKVLHDAQGFLELEEEEPIDDTGLRRALYSSFRGIENYFPGENIDDLLNRIALEVTFERINKVNVPDYQIFDSISLTDRWADQRPSQEGDFWESYKTFLSDKEIAQPTIKKLDLLTNDILNRLGNPLQGGSWDKRGMIVGDVQSGKTSNYIGLINKAADAGYRIIIVLSGLYETLRKQTQQRIDEGFTGHHSMTDKPGLIGSGKYRKTTLPPVHPITHSGEDGDLKLRNLRNHPLNTNDYYALVIKKNPTVLKSLLTWFCNSTNAEKAGDTLLIRNIPLLVIDDEADYASLNISKDFVSTINGQIRALLGLFDQSAFVGYTATPFANIFITDINETREKTITVNGNRIRLGDELFPKDFIINIPPPSNYIGYTKIFGTELDEAEEGEDKLLTVNIIGGDDASIPKSHRKNDELPVSIPDDLKTAVCCFVIVCATRMARGQEKDHNSMLVHVSWYVRWINHIAGLVNEYMEEVRNLIRYDTDGEFSDRMRQIWSAEFSGKSDAVMKQMGYSDPRVMEHTWEEISQYLTAAAEKIEVRAVHGPQKGLSYENMQPLNYEDHENGLWVIAVGGNKLSRGLTLESLSISYFLRATKFYDTLLQMGRWFGYRPGYADLCRLFTTSELILWYQYIAGATEELKEQFDVMELAERTPQNYGLKVRKTPGKMLMISSAIKTRGATDLEMSFSGELLETYILSKSPGVLSRNLETAGTLLKNLGLPPGKERQGQKLIWENIHVDLVDQFLLAYRTEQTNIYPQFLRGYFALQATRGHLINWTVVFISNTQDEAAYQFRTDHGNYNIGRTLRQQRVFEDADGREFTDPDIYWIRKSHIISPPHEYLDMDADDNRWQQAKKQADTDGTRSIGKYVRKHRGPRYGLLLVYVLDPSGFTGTDDLPAIGYAISLPVIDHDKGVSYMVNQQYIDELTTMFGAPEDAQEDPEALTDQQ
ncbi:Z1 domain-containing protein [Mucilaginibacter sp. dw_454]|uniref:Z1 domain-containing protein n=1 Tax=Mucilaginibacter sp. dw_454 TaxID=2720079 RepID=UPI001BD2A617|nr:Z1 domain-containing protein [Mucilaginibacter sp. dw_454]